MARLKGAALILKLGSPGVDYKVDLTSYRITNAEKAADVTTFGDVAAGDDRDYMLQFTAVQDTASGSLWRYIWESAGTEGVAYTVAPHGNATPTADEPHLTGTLTIGPAPELGGDANKDTTYTFDGEWKLDAKPTLDTGA